MARSARPAPSPSTLISDGATTSEKNITLPIHNVKESSSTKFKRLPMPVTRLLSVCLLFTALLNAAPVEPLPPLREQAAIQQQWLKLRLERVLPPLMRKHGVQMWLVVCREYNEDPVFLSLVSPSTFAARR